ncbi:MAG: hypothetical protein AAF208_08375 [Cyanobacteria bacterium P01_A01_bin.45]
MLFIKKTFRHSKLPILILATGGISAGSIIINVPVLLAHKIKTDTDVGATLHIEPNDNPQAGTPTTLWFALTRKGGKVIPLEECNCQLKIYKEPVKQKDSSIIQPNLKPISAEKYQGIPGAEVTFPTPGAYQLRFSGTPVDETKSFSPFELKFPVTVAVGKNIVEKVEKTVLEKTQNQAQAPETRNKETIQKNTPDFPLWIILATGAIAPAVIFIGLSKLKSNKDN